MVVVGPLWAGNVSCDQRRRCGGGGGTRKWWPILSPPLLLVLPLLQCRRTGVKWKPSALGSLCWAMVAAVGELLHTLAWLPLLLLLLKLPCCLVRCLLSLHRLASDGGNRAGSSSPPPPPPLTVPSARGDSGGGALYW